MKNIEQIRLVFTYSDGTVNYAALDAMKTNQVLSDGITQAAVDLENLTGLAPEYRIRLYTIISKPIKTIDVEFTVTQEALYAQPKVFISGMTTNDIARIEEFKDCIGGFSRDIVALYRPDNKYLFCAAFTSVDRFWTYIKFTQNSMLFRYAMEDKPLKADEIYELEHFITNDTVCIEDFLKLYTDIMAKRYEVHISREIPTGWCSWSCYYSLVDQEKIERANKELTTYYAEKKTNLVQIDDGWQVGGSFSGYWTPKPDTFPNGLKVLSDRCHQEHREFGLWLAPLLATDFSGYFNEFPNQKHSYVPKGQNDYCFMNGTNKTFPLKLDEKEVKEHLTKVFRRAVQEYGASYFKLDFMVFSIHRVDDREQVIIYEEDYIVAHYRKTLKLIREAVGENTLLLACGAPIAEGAGLFNAIRVTPDIVWAKSKDYPTYWELIKWCSKSMALRYFYHKDLFIIDPDGVMLRDFDYDDGFDASYQEVKTWATSIAMCGGSELINEQIAKIGPSRRELFEQILPPLGISARPLDFFEQPQPSVNYISLSKDAKLVSIYNWADTIENKVIPTAQLGLSGKVLCYECWGKSFKGVITGDVTAYNMMRHSALIYLLRNLPDVPAFIFANTNVYAGVDMIQSSYENGELTVNINDKILTCSCSDYFIFLPAGYEMNEGEQVFENEDGKVKKLSSAKPGRYQFGCIRQNPAGTNTVH